MLGRRRPFPSIPNPGLGGAAVLAAGTPEQKERFLAPFREGKPKWGAMAITEPGCGSDSAAITTTATRDGDDWVINGTKIFCTAGGCRWRNPKASWWSGRRLIAAPDAPGSSPSWSSTIRPGCRSRGSKTNSASAPQRYRRCSSSTTAACPQPSARQRGGQARRRRFQGRDGDLRRDPADRGRDGDRGGARGARFRARFSGRAERSRFATASRRGA